MILFEKDRSCLMILNNLVTGHFISISRSQEKIRACSNYMYVTALSC